MKIKRRFLRRILMSVVGVLLLAIAVGFLRVSALGVDPFTTLITGLDAIIPLKYGLVYILANVVLLVFSLCFNRHLIGIATFVNLFLLGYITQFTHSLLISLVGETPLLAIRIVFFVIAIIVLCFGSAFYITADLGVSTYDAIALTMANKWKWGKFKFIRIASDFICILIGVSLYMLAGNPFKGIFTFVSVGTIIIAFFMGPLIDFFNVHCAEPFLNKIPKETEQIETEQKSE